MFSDAHESNAIGYYIDKKDTIIEYLSKRRDHLEKLRFTCSQSELEEIELTIQKISNSIYFHKNYLWDLFRNSSKSIR